MCACQSQSREQPSCLYLPFGLNAARSITGTSTNQGIGCLCIGASTAIAHDGRDTKNRHMHHMHNAVTAHAEQWSTGAGVDRGSSFPDVGAQEWTYCRMMETMLRSIAQFDTRFLIRNLTFIPEGLHVLKHIPMSPHYTDRTILQAGPRSQALPAPILQHCMQKRA